MSEAQMKFLWRYVSHCKNQSCLKLIKNLWFHETSVLRHVKYQEQKQNKAKSIFFFLRFIKNLLQCEKSYECLIYVETLLLIAMKKFTEKIPGENYCVWILMFLFPLEFGNIWIGVKHKTTLLFRICFN